MFQQSTLKHGFELIGFDVAAYSKDIDRKEVRLEFGLKIKYKSA